MPNLKIIFRHSLVACANTHKQTQDAKSLRMSFSAHNILSPSEEKVGEISLHFNVHKKFINLKKNLQMFIKLKKKPFYFFLSLLNQNKKIKKQTKKGPHLCVK